MSLPVQHVFLPLLAVYTTAQGVGLMCALTNVKAPHRPLLVGGDNNRPGLRCLTADAACLSGIYPLACEK